MNPTIIQFEAKRLFREATLAFTWILFTIAGVLSVETGAGHYEGQKAEMDTLSRKLDVSLVKLQGKLEDARTNNTEPSGFDSPTDIDRNIQEYASRRLNPLSALSIGQSDVYPMFRRTRMYSNIFMNEQDAFKNPQQLMTGNLDLSFFVLFIFPILFITLGFNVASFDRETGISRLLDVQAGDSNRLILPRLIFRWIISISPVLIALGFAYVKLNDEPDFTLASFSLWSIVALVYCIFWFGIVLLVNHQGLSSILNALILAGIWLLLLTGIPGILNTWYQFSNPNHISAEVTRLRDEQPRILSRPLATHKEVIRQHGPALTYKYKAQDSNLVKMYGYTIAVIEKEKELHDAISDRLEKQMETEKHLFLINPVAGFMKAFGQVSNTTGADRISFERAVLELRMRKTDYLFLHLLNKKEITPKTIGAIPLYKQIKK
jgi:ABC-type transport system involved in multi-copper enzyme maturation permease subunit